MDSAVAKESRKGREHDDDDDDEETKRKILN